MIHRSKEVRGWGVGEMEDRTLTTAPEFTSYFLARKRILIHKSGSRMFSGEIHGAQISDSLQKSSNSADLTFSVQVTKSGLRALIWGSLRWDGRLPIVLDEDNTGLREQQCIRPRNLSGQGGTVWVLLPGGQPLCGDTRHQKSEVFLPSHREDRHGKWKRGPLAYLSRGEEPRT